MRIGLFTEGTYPVVTGGVSTWCEHLINGMPEHEFVPVTLIAGTERALGGLPSNVRDVTLIPMWGRVPPSLPFVDTWDERKLAKILAALWTALIPASGPTDLQGFAACLRALTEWRGYRLSSLVSRSGSTRWILRAWQARRVGHPELPPMALADAASAAILTDRVLALADQTWPDVDVSHVASNGSPSILALGRLWSKGTPILVTEHGIYLRERYLALAQSDMVWSARHVVGCFLRALTQLTYAEASRIAPVSDFNRRWELRLGADPGRTATVYNGVDTQTYQPIPDEPAVPTIAFVGRINPLKDLETMIDAFALVTRQIPDARLRLFGPTAPVDADYRAALEAQIARLGLGAAVSFEGSVDNSMIGFRTGHVVALSSISEGLPYGVIEAMMAGRPTVNTDVGGISEIVGTDGVAGVVVPPRSPDQMADALVRLLRDPALRASMGRAARQRAVSIFDMGLFIEHYRHLYAETAAGPSDYWGPSDRSDHA